MSTSDKSQTIYPRADYITVYRIKFFGSTLTVDSFDTAIAEVKSLARQADPCGDEITLEVSEMPRAEYEALPEFGGW